jgi:hypothetical protein
MCQALGLEKLKAGSGVCPFRHDGMIGGNRTSGETTKERALLNWTAWEELEGPWQLRLQTFSDSCLERLSA